MSEVQTADKKDMRDICVCYFAFMKEKAGRDQEHLRTAAVTALQLFQELDVVYDFKVDTQVMRVAVNDCFAGWDQGLADGDVVAFIPPVNGG